MTNSFYFFKTDIQVDISKIHPSIGHLIFAEMSSLELFDRAGWLSWSSIPHLAQNRAYKEVIENTSEKNKQS